MIDFFQRGGPIMYLLAICSVLALGITLEKLWNLRRSKVIGDDFFDTVVALIEGGRIDTALEHCRRNPGVFHSIIGAALEHFPYGRDEVKEAILDAGRQETPRLERYLNTLATIAGIAPLMGLLGTILGMIQVFGAISREGTGDAQVLAAGIGQALITTATGLPIAIFALVSYNYFSQKAEGIILEIEKYSIGLTNQLFRAPEAEARGAAAGDAVTK